MEDYVSIMETQSEIMGAMEKLLTNFKKDSSERKTPAYIKRRLETLDQYWNEFQDNHVKLEEITDKLSYAYFTESYYEQTKKYYFETKTYIEKFSSMLSNTERQNQPGTSRATEPKPDFRSSTPVQVEVKSTPIPNSNISNLLRKQEANFKAFQRTVGLIDVEAITEKWEFEDALRSLQTRWSLVDNLHWDIVYEAGDENISYEKKFDYFEKQFNNLKKSINTKMWSMSHREKSTPQLDIPVFSGSYNYWVSFKDLFTEAIHNNPCLSSAQKMQFLKSKVRGEAERLIQHLTISSENYLAAWNILSNRYNNKKLIFTSYLNNLLGLANMQQQSVGQIKKMHDVSIETFNAIKNLEVDITTWDPILVHLLSQKLDSDTHADYIGSLKNPRDLPVLQEFLDFLEGKFTALESSRRKQENNQQLRLSNNERENRKQKPFFQNQRYHQALTSKGFHSDKTVDTNNFQHKNTKPFMKSLHVSSTFKCPLCNQDHGIYNCKNFLEMPNDQKLRTVNKLKLCANCLFSHNGNPCISTRTCRKCTDQHNTLLHDAYNQAMPTATPKSLTSKKQNETSSHVSQNNYSEVLLATAILKVKAADGTFQQMRALIDQGSQISLISENAAQRLCLKRQKCKGTIFGVGQQENTCKGVINIECASLYNDFTFNAEVLIMNNLIKNLPNKTFNKPSWNFISNINLADPEFYTSRPVDILLGADVYSRILLSGIIKVEDSTAPIAQQTELGWLLCGHAKTSYQCNVIMNNTETIERFWEIEEITESASLSVEDQECINFYNTTTVRKEDGRYEVRLPLKPDIQQKLGSSKQMAVAQFRNLEKRFEKHEQLSKDYKEFMNEYETLNHMKPDDEDIDSYIECYLPHHGVHRSESSTTKYRVVFNASAPTSSGYTLNDLMYAGPNLQQDLQILLIKWRQYRYAFTADIEKMYRQTLINKQDQNLQKIVWRESSRQPLKTYKLATVTYGTKAAPFLAMMTLRKLATDEQNNFPIASKVLTSSFFVDDLVHGSGTIEQGKQLISELRLLLQKGGMNLRKWSSNNSDLLSDLQKGDNKDENKVFNFKTGDTSKTLGLCWNSSSDQFTFNYQVVTQNIKPTKRCLLSDISKLFDPLGWLAPLSTKLKLLFQSLWKLNLKWDDTVPDDIYKEWSKLKADIHLINSFEIPRWLLCSATDVIQLHGFCDASEKAYACVVYARIHNNLKSIIVAAKSKLVPHKKALSLPKLELSGALLLSKLIDKIKTALNQHQIEFYCWTDSMAVLGWIQGKPNR